MVIYVYMFHVRAIKNVLYSYFTIKQQMHIYNYFQSHIILFQKHVPATSENIIRVPFIDFILVIRHPDNGDRSGRNMLVKVK
jgi:hypothetical protein